MKYNNLTKIFLSALIVLFTVNNGFCSIATDAKLEYNKGIDFHEAGQLEESAQCFKRAIELDPNYIDAYYNLGTILDFLGQQEAALAVFKQIILRNPEDYEAVYKAAVLSKKTGEIEKAKMYLTLIPPESPFGIRASSLAASMNTDIPTIKAEQEEEKAAAEAEKRFSTNGVYNDITSPTGVAADSSGVLYVAGFSDNTVYKIGSDDQKIVYIKDEKIDGPIGLAIDSSGNIYIANYNKNNVLKVDKNGVMSELISDIKNPYCLYIVKDILFVSSQGSNSVVRYNLKN